MKLNNIVAQKQFKLKFNVLLFVLLFLNFINWSLIHSVHHYGTKLSYPFSDKIYKYEHIRFGGNVHSHEETSSQNQKKHQKQADIGCLLVFFIYPEKEFLSTRVTTSIKFNEVNIAKKIFPNIDLIQKYYSTSKYFVRGPPIS